MFGDRCMASDRIRYLIMNEILKYRVNLSTMVVLFIPISLMLKIIKDRERGIR